MRFHIGAQPVVKNTTSARVVLVAFERFVGLSVPSYCGVGCVPRMRTSVKSQHRHAGWAVCGV